MSFVNPVLLAVGAALIALPIVLHLIMQQKPRDFTFPALRFVQERLSSNQRRLRVRHWILLVLRCLAVFLIALAFAMPSVASNLFGVWLTVGTLGFLAVLTLLVLIAIALVTKPFNRLLFGVNAAIFAALIASMATVYSNSISGSPKVKLGNDQSPVAAVILIDTSPRMAYRVARELDDGTTSTLSRLEEARQLADWVIRELPDDSDVAITDATAGEPFFSVDIAAAAKRISSLRISNETLSLVESIEESLDFLESLEKQNDKPKEVYVFTDMTLPSWQSKRQKQLQLRLNDLTDLSIYLIDVSVANPTNYRLGELELSSETIAKGGSINLLTRLYREGPPGERPVNLYVDQVEPGKPYRQDGKTVFPGQKLVGSLATKLDENGTEQIAFNLSQLPVGVHHGVIRVEGEDPLMVDNERYFSIEVRPPRKVLLVRPEKKDETESTVASRNVEVVLAPDELVALGQAQFEVRTIGQEKLLETKLTEFESVFLLDPKPLDELEWSALKKFVTSGGGLAVALGANAKTNFSVAKEFVSEEAREVLGGELLDVWTPEFAFLSIEDYSHPLTQKFRAFQTDDVWRDFAVYQHWGMDIDSESEGVSVIARYTTQKPAIVQNRLGKGTVLIWTTPLTEPGQVVGRARWNDLTTGEWWPTALLIDEMAKYLVSSQDNRLNYRVGENVNLVEESSELESFQVFPPDNEEPSEVSIDDQEIRYRFTESVGNYRMKPIGVAGERKGFSVNLPQNETELVVASESVLDSALGKDRYKLARSKEDIIREQSFVREGKKFFSLLITLFGVLLIMEFLMSNRFYRGL